MHPSTLGCLCSECPFREGIPVLPMWPCEGQPASMVVVGEGPGADEEVFGKFFIGASGDFLNNMLDYLTIPKSELYITNCVLCRPRFSASPGHWRRAIACCEPRLQSELSRLRGPRVALAYGGRALYALTGPVLNESVKAASKKLPSIFSWAGAPLKGWKGHYDDWQILATLHPAFCLREKGWPYKPSVYIHTARAWELANGQLDDWEWPPIHTDVSQTTLRALREIRKAKKLTGHDVETRGVNPLKDLCMCMGLANEDVAVCVPWESYRAGRHGEVEAIDATPMGRRIMEEVFAILEDPKIPLAFQNGPHDILTDRARNIDVAGYVWDTLPAHAVVAPGRKHDLGWIMAEECHAPRWKEEKHTASNEKGAKKFSRRHPIQLRTYCAKDSWTPVFLHGPLGQRLSDAGGGWEIYDLYLRNMCVSMRMQQYGFKVDVPTMLEHRRKLGHRKSRAKQELRTLAKKYWPAWGRNFNPASQAHLHKLVFNKLKVRPTKWSTKTEKPSLDKAVLADLKVHDNPLVAAMARALERYRQYAKLRDTYCDPLKLVDRETRCAHTSWRVTGTRTLRWSSSPNLQNIPKPVVDLRKGKDGEIVERVRVAGLRNMFVPHEPGGWIVRGDYDQLEIKIIALLSGCTKLLQWFADGTDIHCALASIYFGREVVKGDPARDASKPVTYGRCYGADERTLLQTLIDAGFVDMTLSKVIGFVQNMAGELPEIDAWHEELLKMAYDERVVVAPISGHELPFYGGVKETEVYNLPVQHTAADILNPAIGPISDQLNWRTEGLVAQVHDELVLDGLNPLKLAKLLVRHMEHDVTLNGHSAKFSIGLKIGKNWAECVPVSRKKPLAQAIREAKEEVLRKEQDHER